MTKNTNEEILHALADIKETIEEIIKEFIIQNHARRIEVLEQRAGLTRQ